MSKPKPVTPDEVEKVVLIMLAALEELFMAGQGVVECWEQGDLAGAVHMLEGALDDVRPIIAQAKQAGIEVTS